MKITFLGAAENVTGSRFFVEHGHSRILIDCGMYQERDFQKRNWDKFPVNPATIQSMILTHAHIDHCGYIPKLVREGFRGKIYCTPATAEITKISLIDAAKLQEADAAYKRRRHKREGRQGPHPEQALFDVEDARKVFHFFRKVKYEQQIKAADDIAATFFDAGHILGSSMIELKVHEHGKERTWVFSGDIGRWHRPILGDPHIFKKADAVVMEATYGNKVHEEEGPSLQKLASVINDTAACDGNVIIPSFAINRTQEILYYLNRLLNENKIPRLMTFVDSPMAVDVTEIYNRYPDDFDAEARDILEKDSSLFDFPLLKMTESAEESKAINHIKGSAIIIAGSGMCTGGRVKHHLANNISKSASTILFVGYQAVGTLGRTILEKPEEVRILGRMHPVRARIEEINGFSAHADKNELLKWAAGFEKDPEKIFIVHSEKDTAHEFASTLKEKVSSDVIVPRYLQECEV